MQVGNTSHSPSLDERPLYRLARSYLASKYPQYSAFENRYFSMDWSPGQQNMADQLGRKANLLWQSVHDVIISAEFHFYDHKFQYSSINSEAYAQYVVSNRNSKKFEYLKDLIPFFNSQFDEIIDSFRHEREIAALKKKQMLKDYEVYLRGWFKVDEILELSIQCDPLRRL